MSGEIHLSNRRAISAFRRAGMDFSESGVRAALADLLLEDTPVRLAFPLNDVAGPDAFYQRAYKGLLHALPDLERRDLIVMAGRTAEGDDWVGCCGHYIGTFERPWLDIPPTGHAAAMRYHEFFWFKEGRVVEVQALWDIPELMIQANAWPLAPSLGRSWFVPGPATQDGLAERPYDEAMTAESYGIVRAMGTAMRKHPLQGGPEIMELERFWHPRMNWYGPGGIGTGRGTRGFRNWHQIPFLAAMPDRGTFKDETKSHYFADGPYVGVTGWPNMKQTISGSGWLGIAPAGTIIHMRSLDFWRIENGLIRENWVLVDVLDVMNQVGIDAFARLREFNKARIGFSPETGHAA